MSLRRVARTWVVALALTVLAGCAGDDAKDPKPKADPASPAGWPPAAVLEVEKPVSPDPFGPYTVATAREFAEYVVAEVNYTLQTTYVDRLLRNSRCGVCTGVVDMADDAMAERHLFETDGWSIRSISLRRPQPKLDLPYSYWLFDLVVHLAPVVTVDEDGRQQGRVRGRTLATQLLVANTGNKWGLLQWDTLDVEADPQGSA